jgi:hypothetical protein
MRVSRVKSTYQDNNYTKSLRSNVNVNQPKRSRSLSPNLNKNIYNHNIKPNFTKNINKTRDQEILKLQEEQDISTKSKMGIIIDLPQDQNLNSDNLENINNWSKENTNSVLTWKTTIEKSNYIYTYVSNYNSKKLNNFLMYSLFFTTIATIISSITTALLSPKLDNSEEETKVNNNNTQTKEDNLKFTLSSISFVLTSINFFLVGAIKIYKWELTVNTFLVYIEKLNSFYYILSSELILPVHSRSDFDVFISKHSPTFLDLIKNAPNIDQLNIYEEANLKYKKFIK